ncbi:hypothetical protein BC832DRAFT_160883 [Gaertneriomyces semiglobifer]|nr:hypothetical protein BC832DRAFT_160883 [Gaertneriomyces semiglobifer]
MSVTFEQNKVGPQDPGYKYDMQQYFAPAERSNDWDEDSDVEDPMVMDSPDASSADREPHLSNEVNYQPKLSNAVMSDGLELEPLSFGQRSSHQDNVSSSSLFREETRLPDVETHIAEAPVFEKSGLVDDVAPTAVPQVAWSASRRPNAEDADVRNGSESLPPISTLMRTPFTPLHESAVASISDYDFEDVGSRDRQPHVIITRTAPTVSATTPAPISAIPVDVSSPRDGNEGDTHEGPNRYTAEPSFRDSDSGQKSIPSEVEPRFHRLEEANAEIAHPTADSNSEQNQLMAEESPGYDHLPGIANITKLRPLRTLPPLGGALRGPTMGIVPSDGMLHRPKSWTTSEVGDASETPPNETIQHVHLEEDSDALNFDEDDVYSLPYSEGAEEHSTETGRTKGLEAATSSPVLDGNPTQDQDGEAADDSEPVSIDEYSSDFGAGHTDMEEGHIATDDDDEIVFSDNDLSFDHGGTDDEADSVVG